MLSCSLCTAATRGNALSKTGYYRRCKCPVWVEGTTEAGQYIRRSLKLNNWERAEEKKRELEGVEEVPPPSKPQHPNVITVRDAFSAFYKDCEARNLNDATLRKYRLLRDRLGDFAGLHCPLLAMTTEQAQTTERKRAEPLDGRDRTGPQRRTETVSGRDVQIPEI